MAAIGRRKGVADVFGIPLSGLPAWLLWRAYYLSQMPTFGRKLRIFVEWTWGMFFPNDITHLRFTRSPELDGRATSPIAVPTRVDRPRREWSARLSSADDCLRRDAPPPRAARLRRQLASVALVLRTKRAS